MSDKIYESDLFQSAPDAPTRELREAASLLHARIVLSCTETVKTLSKTRSAEDVRNAVASAVVSALAEITLGFRIDREHVRVLWETQIDKLTKVVNHRVDPFGM